MFDASGQLLALHYAPPLSVWRDDAHREIETPELVDVAADPLRREVVVLAIDGSVLRFAADTVQAVGALPGATMIASAPHAGFIVGGHATGVSLRDTSGRLMWIPSPDARLSALAVSPDERYLIGGRSDGTIAVWTPQGTLRAVLRGHRHRVASLAFASNGMLYSAGWDGRVLAWDLGALGATGDALAARASTTWALDLELVLRVR